MGIRFDFGIDRCIDVFLTPPQVPLRGWDPADGIGVDAIDGTEAPAGVAAAPAEAESGRKLICGRFVLDPIEGSGTKLIEDPILLI
jgi:hypothetical protein